MKKDTAKIYRSHYCYEYTLSDWDEVDNGFESTEAWSETVYAPTPGKARYKAWCRMDLIKVDFLKIKIRRKRELDLIENPIQHPLITKLTKSHVDKMFHAVGATNPEIGRTSFYRNRFVCAMDHDWEYLIELGLAAKYASPHVTGGNIYTLTDEGAAVVRSKLPILRWQYDNIEETKRKLIA